MKTSTITFLFAAGLAVSLLGTACTNTQDSTQAGQSGATSPVDPSRAAGRPTTARQTGAGATQTTNRATAGPSGG